MKVQFAALAARLGLTESGLMARLAEEVVRTNPPVPGRAASAPIAQVQSAAEVDVGDRITVRLRRGDRACVAQRASARGMKTSSYLTLLVHNHVRAVDVLPPQELDKIKAASAQLGAIGRALRNFGAPKFPLDEATSAFVDLLEQVRSEVEHARRESADVVRRNLQSWESGHA
ncbi:hypothetical protein [uncultured Variovorax sp.]|jgi:hypothetical protein|uniref:hypothetical protein n=1 Tax=uncultured Variovorax sp. TaxID=114708 RepID=UPI00260AFB48|nr:hypothetical protein [uncultured Variovorax sp.]